MTETSLFRTTFSDRSVLITGHTGFKGAWLSLWLDRLGARVSGYALPPATRPNLFAAAGIEGRLARHQIGDVRDAAGLAQEVQAGVPELIFHLAAQATVRASYREPAATFATNTMGTINLLEAVRRAGRPCVVIVVTTDKVYENREWVHGYRETDRLGGVDPYSTSKAAAELVVAAYRRSFFPPERVAEHGVKLATVRAGNVLGGGDWSEDRIVPDAIRALSQGEPFVVRNPGAIRPWQHVLEPLSGYLLLAARMLADDDPRWCEAWNFGPPPGRLHTVAELADAVVQAWGAGRWTSETQDGAPHEAGLLQLSIAKARARLGWHPRWDFATTIQRTVAWYRDFYAAGDRPECVPELCLRDIADYRSPVKPST